MEKNNSASKAISSSFQYSNWMLGFQSRTSADNFWLLEVDFYTVFITSPFSIGNQENLWSLSDSRIVTKPCQDGDWKRWGWAEEKLWSVPIPPNLSTSPSSSILPVQLRVPSRITHWDNKNNGCWFRGWGWFIILWISRRPIIGT